MADGTSEQEWQKHLDDLLLERRQREQEPHQPEDRVEDGRQHEDDEEGSPVADEVAQFPAGDELNGRTTHT